MERKELIRKILKEYDEYDLPKSPWTVKNRAETIGGMGPAIGAKTGSYQPVQSYLKNQFRKKRFALMRPVTKEIQRIKATKDYYVGDPLLDEQIIKLTTLRNILKSLTQENDAETLHHLYQQRHGTNRVSFIDYMLDYFNITDGDIIQQSGH